jgi:glutathione S-transferase
VRTDSPVVFLALKFRGIEKIGRLGPAMQVLALARGQMGVHLDALEEQLAKTGGPWILGEMFSLADVSWLVIFERLRRADSLDAFLGGDRRPQCAAYWERLRARPSYRAAIRNQGHPTIDYGTERLRQAKAASAELRVLLEGAAP